MMRLHRETVTETASPIALAPTERGFLRGEFRDANGDAGSIQESSVATEPMLWLGQDNVTNPNGERVPCRMHLTQELAAALIPLLQRFVATGGLR
jgi:hypothetical protein